MGEQDRGRLVAETLSEPATKESVPGLRSPNSNVEAEKESLDGDPLEDDVDGEPLEDLDGEPLGEGIDGEPIQEDLDVEPTEQENTKQGDRKGNDEEAL